MSTIIKLKSGSWRAQIRRNGQYASSTFRAQADAQRWARDIERRVDLGQTIGAAVGHNLSRGHRIAYRRYVRSGPRATPKQGLLP